MDVYSVEDAERDLLVVLDKAPKAAVSGEWTASTMQAGHSSRSGGYADTRGGNVRQDAGDSLDIIDSVIERLEASSSVKFNCVTIRWRKARFPWRRGEVKVETAFDPATVPRPADAPVFEAAAAIRREFWQGQGALVDGYAAQRGEPNSYGQTKWFGPHRRVVLVRQTDRVLLATDGLSTPWAGIPDPENGVECELMLELDTIDSGEGQISLWADLLISIGDLVADGYRVARDVEKHGAILFCRLTDDYRPTTHMILSKSSFIIEDMPFGPVPIIRATPVTDEEIVEPAQDAEWDAPAARAALKRRGIEI